MTSLTEEEKLGYDPARIAQTWQVGIASATAIPCYQWHTYVDVHVRERVGVASALVHCYHWHTYVASVFLEFTTTCTRADGGCYNNVIYCTCMYMYLS